MLDHIYNITAKEEDYVNPNVEGIMDWQCDSSCMTDSDDGLENWQNRLYELHGHRCARITKSLRWLGSQTRPLPIFDGSTDPEEFIEQFLAQILDSQKMETLDLALKAIAARWWTGHRKNTPSWKACQQFLRLKVQSGFAGKNSPHGHWAQYYAAWQHVPQKAWVHRFVHTLEPIAKH